MDGLGIAELNMFVKKYVSSHRAPQYIFIAFDEATLGMEKSVWYFPQYFPFVNDPDLNEMIKLEPKLLLGKYAPPLAITHIDDPLKNLGLIGMLKDYHKKEYSIPLKGFSPAYVSGIKDDLPIEPTYFVGCKHGWELLEQTLDFCEQRNIHVDFILPPRYNRTLSDSTQRVVAKLQSYGSQYRTTLFNFVENETLNSKKLFPNHTHVNALGAEIFTSLLARQFLIAHPEFLHDEAADLDPVEALRYE